MSGADTYRVILTGDALTDLERICDCVREDSPQNAATIAESILTATDSLAFMPGRYKRVGTSLSRRTPIHTTTDWPFIIYYRVEKIQMAVYILTIRHGRRRQPRRFS